MYPLLLKAALKDYIWGGTRLKNDYGYKTDLKKVAEAWVLSCHKDGKCVILNGDMQGKTLDDAIKEWGSSILGEKGLKESTFPLLVKLIDAKDKLSVQVHPDDEYALKHEHDNGKTELWYVIDCRENAKIVYGLKKSVTSDEFRNMISDNTLDDILNYVEVHKGDAFFIKPGTIHAIGGGILIAEIQKSSNVTYRVSDYGRLGADGKPRPLQIDKAAMVSSLEPSDYPFGNIGTVTEYDNMRFRQLVSCEYFTGGIVTMDKGAVYHINNSLSFVSLIALSGSAHLSYDQRKISISKGDSLFIPAGVKCEIFSDSDTEFLYSSL